MGEVGGIAIIADSQGAGEFTAYPDALRFIIAVRDDRHPCRRGLLLQECGPLPPSDRLDTLAEENGLESEHVTPGLTLLEFFDAGISGRDFAQVSRILRSSSRGQGAGRAAGGVLRR